ncbi:hypothetical protein ACTJK6_11240 [Ralstonia sp. 22086]|uniref:hypothetical protein n=1 Tax=Ralstonia TaxID=48736 RepID=UPI001E38C362|nr:hypothetical protein [Ralstonia wenshanensis]MCT7305219.1 hypothetical protein [Ralstonia wenshanensis]MDY7510374.1 hypothetical protein [Ralstonia wenshanensis]UGS89003.1 hypothetical protein KOL96_01755 [Ralstonia wenshanensis]
MRHPEQQAPASYSPLSAVAPTPRATQETARLVAETIPFNLERNGRSIEATYSTRNGIVTVKYRGKTLSTYSPQGAEADYKAVARQLLSVMLTI